MNITRIDNDEAIKLAADMKLTKHHVLVSGDKRFNTEIMNQHGSLYWVWKCGVTDSTWLMHNQLEPMLRLDIAHVELETPSPFDDEAFKEWESFDNGRARTRPNSGSTLMIYLDGSVYLHGFRYTVVPADKIPEVARLINQLLALGEQ
jgi:hypothetical protein